MLSFIQFFHPGSEHQFDDWNGDLFPFKNWNVGDHKRKFVCSDATFIENGVKKQEKLMFWCEWEPMSIVEKCLETDYTKIEGNEKLNFSGLPKFLHSHLFYQEINEWKQNTDPCVFGNQFHFSLCQQSKQKKNSKDRTGTLLTKLERGSIILFGSYKQNQMTKQSLFLIDTVFVIADWIDYNSNKELTNIQDSRISKEYEEICTKFILDPQPFKRRLYFGANFENPINGMYSFFPAQVYSDNNIGFERPNIQNEFINEKMNTGFKSSQIIDSNEMFKIWNSIRQQIRDRGLVEGVHVEMPNKIEGRTSFKEIEKKGC